MLLALAANASGRVSRGITLVVMIREFLLTRYILSVIERERSR
jgi:hypothetical protein